MDPTATSVPAMFSQKPYARNLVLFWRPGGFSIRQCPQTCTLIVAVPSAPRLKPPRLPNSARTMHVVATLSGASCARRVFVDPVRPRFRATRSASFAARSVYPEDGFPTSSDVELMEKGLVNDSPLFTPEFRAVLRDALQHERESRAKELERYMELAKQQVAQMEAAGPPKPPEAQSAEEEVLLSAIEGTRASIARMQLLKEQAELGLDMERRQLERLRFILDKVKQNQAFKSVVETLGKEQTH